MAAIGQAPLARGERTARLVMKTMALFILGRWGDARAAIDSVRLTGGARATTLILSKWTNDGAVRALRGIAAAKSRDTPGARTELTAIRALPESAVSTNYPAGYVFRDLYDAEVLAALGQKDAALRTLADGQARGALPRYDTDDMIPHAWPDAIDLWRDPRFVALFAGQD